MNLLVAEKLYGELINYIYKDNFGLRSAEAFSCPPPPAIFASLPVDLSITLPVSGTAGDEVIPAASQCAGALLLGDWSVDRQTPSKPSWITLSQPSTGGLTGVGGKLTATPTATEEGTYSVRISYYSPVNSATVDATFVLDVYPSTPRALNPPVGTCVPDIYPLTFGN